MSFQNVRRLSTYASIEHPPILKILLREYHSKELKTNYKLMKILNEQYYQPGFLTLLLVPERRTQVLGTNRFWSVDP